MAYEAEILRVLAEAGKEGLSVRKISHHVLNACNTLFEPVAYADVYGYVSQYLSRNAKSANTLVERTDTRGRYRLNLKNTKTRQLMLQFRDEDELDASPAEEDLSLSLF